MLFDDVIARGSSMENLKLKLERVGAEVIGGFSIRRTLHERLSCNPIDNIDQFNSRRTTSDYNDDLPF